LTDELIGAVVAAVRPVRAGGHGAAWELLVPEQARIGEWIEKARLQLTNIHGKLARRGIWVPDRTSHRFAVERCGFTTRPATLRVADGDPGVECQADFGRLGLVPDPLPRVHRGEDQPVGQPAPAGHRHGGRPTRPPRPPRVEPVLDRSPRRATRRGASTRVTPILPGASGELHPRSG